jgi:hypothetical protein
VMLPPSMMLNTITFPPLYGGQLYFMRAVGWQRRRRFRRRLLECTV